jgi:septum formation protein
MLKLSLELKLNGVLLSNSIKIILASNSPRRKELLSLFGYEFTVQPADVDETPHEGEYPGDYVSRLAEAKACETGESILKDTLVIAADTTVADGRMLLGKPEDEKESRQMLEQLRNRTHQVYTGMAILDKNSNKVYSELSCTDVPMRDYTDIEIDEYIASGDPFDKAGGYAIQHPEFRPVKELSGCYANVMGLPLCHLSRTMIQMGIVTENDTPVLCQQTLDYDCDVYERVLKGEL